MKREKFWGYPADAYSSLLRSNDTLIALIAPESSIEKMLSPVTELGEASYPSL